MRKRKCTQALHLQHELKYALLIALSSVTSAANQVQKSELSVLQFNSQQFDLRPSVGLSTHIHQLFLTSFIHCFRLLFPSSFFNNSCLLTSLISSPSTSFLRIILNSIQLPSLRHSSTCSTPGVSYNNTLTYLLH